MGVAEKAYTSPLDFSGWSLVKCLELFEISLSVVVRTFDLAMFITSVS
jgi:hypothetical protein